MEVEFATMKRKVTLVGESQLALDQKRKNSEVVNL